MPTILRFTMHLPQHAQRPDAYATLLRERMYLVTRREGGWRWEFLCEEGDTIQTGPLTGQELAMADVRRKLGSVSLCWTPLWAILL